MPDIALDGFELVEEKDDKATVKFVQKTTKDGKTNEQKIEAKLVKKDGKWCFKGFAFGF